MARASRPAATTVLALALGAVALGGLALLVTDRPLRAEAAAARAEAMRAPPDALNANPLLAAELQVPSVRAVGEVFPNEFRTGSADAICVDPARPDCDALCCWSAERIDAVWEANRALLEILEKALTFERYHPVHDTLPVGGLVSLGYAAMLDAVRAIEHGETTAAYEKAIAAARLFRRVRAAPSAPEHRAAAMMALHLQLDVIAHLLRRHEVPAGSVAALDAALAPNPVASGLRSEMLGILRGIERYRNARSQLLRGPPELFGEPTPLERAFAGLHARVAFHPNATANALLDKLQRALASPSAPCFSGELHVPSRGPRFGYNQLGRFLFVERFTPELVAELEHRLDALLQLVRTVQAIGPSGDVERLAAVEQRTGIPERYTGEPARWDRESGRLSLSYGDGEACTVWVPVPR